MNGYGIELKPVTNHDGTVTIFAVNTSKVAVDYSNLYVATGASTQYFNASQLVTGLTASPAQAVKLSVPSSGSFPASHKMVALVTFIPSDSPTLYDGGYMSLNGEPNVRAVAYQAPQHKKPVLPDWAGIALVLPVFAGMLVARRKRRNVA